MSGLAAALVNPAASAPKAFRMTPELQPIDVAAGLVFRGGKLLIAQRPEGSHLAGLWEFPGGKREEGELWPDCLIRELQEELGVVVKVGEVFEEVVHRYPEKVVRLRFFLATLDAGEPRPLGCANVNWVTRSELSKYAFPPADAELIQRLMATDGLWTE
ncbi:MAG: 8-oxo-dGTP diphosphatase MutT [Verrucomicrobiales bacterium]|nr:8-oxo-dGTP diphosphatase MutT [Verrucomicrobiales bacterium]